MAACAAVLAALLGVSVVPSSALTSATITIDGDLADWTGVRADQANSSHDTQISDPDPDFPGQPDRDVYLVNATWDSQYLYMAFRRTAGGTKAITFAGYIDRGGDGLLQGGDVVTWWTVGQSDSSRFADAHAPSPTAGIFTYNQAINGNGGPFVHPAGDPMGHDGETPDGWADVQSGALPLAQPMDGWMADNGIEFEGRVAWSDLGLSPGSPIAIHFVNSNGESFGQKWVPSNTRKWTGNPPQYLEENRGQVEDNVDDIWWLLTKGVDVSPNNQSGGDAGSTLVYSHTITNKSNKADTIDLSALSSQGWDVSITDAAGNPISTVMLAAGASTSVNVRVHIPAGTTGGTTDVTVLTGASRLDPTEIDTATDTTTSGLVVVSPNQSATMAPGQTVTYIFGVNNNMGSSKVFDLSALSSSGFPHTITDMAGAPITAVTLEAGGSTQVKVVVTVPAGATTGSQDVTRLTAAVQGSPAIRGSAVAITTVEDGLSITPNNAGFGGSNSVVTYSHTITNSWPTARLINLSGLSSHGWPVTVYDADGVTPLSSVMIGPNGATHDIMVRVSIPAGTADNTIDLATIRAATGVYADTAIDTTTVRKLQLYDNAGYTHLENLFELGESGFARATGLSSGSTVYYVWKDASGTVRRTSPDRTVDTAGMSFDTYPFAQTDPTGNWTVELWHRANGNKLTLLDTVPYTVTWNANIAALSATDAPGVGSDVAVTSAAQNDNTRTLANTSMTYVMWWDTNGDDVFDSGDTWVDSAGQPHVWDGVTAVTSHVTSGITVAGGATWTETTPWTVNNRDFPFEGDYNITATWREPNGNLIDTKTTQFYSIPALGWPLFAGLLGIVAVVMARRLKPALARAGERP